MLKFEFIKLFIIVIIIFIVISLLVCFCLILNKMLTKFNVKKPVECGSHSFGSGKNRIEFICYKISILFVVFEVELIMLIPFFLYCKLTYLYSFMPICLFLIILGIGLIFEYSRQSFKLPK